MKKLIISVILITVLFTVGRSQELYYLDEGFEDTESVSKWTVFPIIPNKEWEYTYGGQWTYGGDPANPEIPKQGDMNAGLYYSSLELDTVKLISPQLELGGAKKPILRFWHCQYEHPKGPDCLRLFFRRNPSSEWDLIQQWTSSIDYWKDEIFDIEDIDNDYLTDSFQLAFEGIIGNGYGVYVDSVTVIEDTIVQKYVKRTTYNSVEYEAIPSGATNIPLEEIVIRILGNSGEAVLDSLTLIPRYAGINYLEEDSFKLFYSVEGVYAPFRDDTSTLIATASLNSGEVTFAGIGYNLRLGDNHLWVAASFKNTLQGNTTLRFSVPANGINVSDTLFPSSQKIMPGIHRIYETVFYDDFESGGATWTLEGDFEVGWPEGTQVGTQKNPETPFNGMKILATDLDSGYYANISTSDSYYAYMPELDLTYYIKAGLYMHSYFAINGPDHAVIDASVDGGSTWQNIWTSSQSGNNSYWSEFYDESIRELAKRQSRFQLRFGIVETENVPWPGFSVDNFAILGEKLNSDVGITQVLQPFNGCLGCGNDTVKIWVGNYAEEEASDTIPVYFGLWGIDSTLVRDTIFGGINIDDSTLFTFNEQADFPIGDYYDQFIAGIDLAGDQDPTNDTITKPLIIQKSSTSPHFENFEYKGGIWIPTEGSTWANKDMSGTITTDPASPRIWVLSPTGNYASNDTSAVVSGCYDLSDATRNIVQFKYWSDCEASKDGARFEYTVDEGETWEILEDPVYSTGWNWTVDFVEALGTPGWSGINEWTTAKALLPETIDNKEKVKFRLVFMSDAQNSQPQGFAFNDFEIFPAPRDVGISSIAAPYDDCQGYNSTDVIVRVKNFGYNTLEGQDTIIVGVDFESDDPVIDTFTLGADLLPGDSVDLTVGTDIDIEMAGIYNITAYTLIEDEPWYYLDNNDSISYSFEVFPSPNTGLPDTIQTKEPDTVILEPVFDPDYSYEWDDGSTNPAFNVPKDGVYYLTVTDVGGNGCATFDSVYVELLFNDLGVDSLVSPVTSCGLSNSEFLTVRIRNFGTDSIDTGEEVVVAYELDGGAAVLDTFTLENTLYAYHSIDHTFGKGDVDMSDAGVYQFKLYTDFGGDTVSHNDTIITDVEVYGYPTVDLGPDQVVQALTYTIDAGSGFEDYLWNDGDSIRLHEISTEGYHQVTVTDENGCQDNDSVYVWFKIRDISFDALLNPVSSCEIEDETEIEIRMINTGTDTITTSDQIRVSYKINENAKTEKVFSPGSDVYPGAQVFYSFDNEEDFSEPGDYYMELVASALNDLVTENDTSLDTVYIYPSPVVDFGLAATENVHALEYVLDAGYNENYSYLWQDGPGGHTYTATESKRYRVIVTDDLTGCQGSDSVLLNFIITDIGVTDVGVEGDVCSGTYDELDVQISNLGNASIGSGQEIILAYRIGNGEFSTESIVLTSPLISSGILNYNLDETIEFDEPGGTGLELYTVLGGDLRPENDTLQRSLTVLQSPVVDFGAVNDTLRTSIPHQLDAGSGYAGYEWQDGSNSSLFNVTQPGTYSVTVTSTNGCKTQRTVYVEQGTLISQRDHDPVQVEIYPVPASDHLIIELNAEYVISSDVTLQLLDNSGRLIRNREVFISPGITRERLELNGLPEGMYFIRLMNEEFMYNNKIIIQ